MQNTAVVRGLVFTAGCSLLLVTSFAYLLRLLGYDPAVLDLLRWDVLVCRGPRSRWLSLISAAVFILASTAMPRRLPSRSLPLVCFITLSCIASVQNLLLGTAELGRKVRAQWGWSDERKREAWLAYQFGKVEFLQHCRSTVGARESILFRPLPGHDHNVAVFFAYYLLPRRSFIQHPGRPLGDPRLITDWVVTFFPEQPPRLERHP